MKIIEIGGVHYVAQNIVKIKYNSELKTIGVFTVDKDTDWYDCPSDKEAEAIIRQIEGRLSDE